MFNLSKLSIRYMQPTSLRTVLRLANYSTARPTVIVRSRSPIDTVSANETSVSDGLKQENTSQQPVQKAKEVHTTGLVAAAFASLQEEEKIPVSKQKPTFIERKISKATTLNELLAINEDNGLSRHHALKIVSTLAQWSASGKIELVDFETDPRFVKLCRILSRAVNRTRFPPRNGTRGDDLSMVLGVTGDDEAAKLVASITLPQMIKVMSTLAQKKRRSTPLLRSLAYNISRSTTKLDLKQCADLLYSMTILNFPEAVLLERISNDTIEGLETNTDRSAVIGSILTSIGLLRYRDPGILDALSEWMLKFESICRAQDISALIQTLAVVNHQPTNAESLYNVFIPQLHIADVPKHSAWLDIVWSLVVLNRATSEHIASVLEPEFIEKLQNGSSLSTSLKVKLLNISAAAKYLLPTYTGPQLADNSEVRQITITRTKEKQMMVSSMLDSLGSLFSSSAYLQSNVNSGMGFVIDGECAVDKKCNPVPVSTKRSTDQTRVAILAYDYHDLCRGCSVPHGANTLAVRLLETQGYKLMIVPYTDFNPRDKLVQRVQYLEKQLKFIASQA